MRLFHFSHDANIAEFHPRPVNVPSIRSEGNEWLNGPLVWAIEEKRQCMYLFPRDCPRIIAWCTEDTTESDHDAWFADKRLKAVAFVERDWAKKIRASNLYRYNLPTKSFEDLLDAGMWVSRTAVRPKNVHKIDDLFAELQSQQIGVTAVGALSDFRHLWDTSLHVSGIRLRNAKSW